MYDLCWQCDILCWCWHHTHPSSPCPGSHLTMRTPLHRSAIRPRYTHSHLSITRNKEGIMPVKSQPFLSSPSESVITKRHKKIKDFFLFYTFNEQLSFCIRITCQLSSVRCGEQWAVSGEMAGPVSRVLATMSQYSGWGDHRYQWGHVMPEYCHTSPVIQRQDHTYMHTTAHTHNLDNPESVFVWRFIF